MPELPEVETVRRGLVPHLEGARLSEVRIYREGLRYPFPETFADMLEGATVLQLERRAKYLLAHLDTQYVWVTHLGMTGRFLVSGSAEGLSGFYHEAAATPKHRHVSLTATKGGQSARIDFFDPRRFGFMLLLSPDQLYEARWYKGLGIEPLSEALSGAFLFDIAQGRRVSLKALLMDQRHIAGLGNIYVCEALFMAHLSPLRSADTLSLVEAERLSGAIRDVLAAAVAAGGSSISDFAAASGELGYFQHNFTVYDRQGQACARKGCGGTITRVVQQGRSTFWCPACQS